MERKIKGFLEEKHTLDLLRSLKTVEHLVGGKLRVNDREYVNLSSNDYLGLASHPGIARAASLSTFVGAGSSRLMTGTTQAHARLEQKVAEFKNKPAAIVFNSGYQANVGIISALLEKNDCVLSDRLNHASIVDGISLSKARHFRFRHNDAGHLEELLKKKRSKYEHALIVTETVFSMNGDIAPIEEIVRLKKKYDCTLMVDEAHATGVFGKKGSDR